jgi:alanine racemase
MTLRLTIDERDWRAHVDVVRQAIPRLVPVVKGNGYGFGRATLAAVAATWADEIAVGTVHELADVAMTVGPRADITIVALTPALHLPGELDSRWVPTVGSPAHIDALRHHGFNGSVAVKLESSMHRHGTPPQLLDELVQRVRSAGFAVHEYIVHLPLPSPAFGSTRAVGQIEGWLDRLDPSVPLSVSHMSIESFDRLGHDHPTRSFRLRSGTQLWHGDKSFVHLSADVLEVRPISIGEPVGYRQAPAASSGQLVMIGAGSAHGVAPLDGGLSPFHHARRRMPLVEAPHMHTSMVLVGGDAPAPSVGDWVDVQRPLTHVSADVLDWR